MTVVLKIFVPRIVPWFLVQRRTQRWLTPNRWLHTIGTSLIHQALLNKKKKKTFQNLSSMTIEWLTSHVGPETSCQKCTWMVLSESKFIVARYNWLSSLVLLIKILNPYYFIMKQIIKFCKERLTHEVQQGQWHHKVCSPIEDGCHGNSSAFQMSRKNLTQDKPCNWKIYNHDGLLI